MASDMVGTFASPNPNTNAALMSGATDHVVHSLSCFTTVAATVNTFVNLPNGEIALVIHVGTVRILENLILTNPEIWHSRLGHFSNAKLALIRNTNVHIDNANKVFNCEICPLAKQKRLPFAISTHVSNECFDLIHCDLWGPFFVLTVVGCKFFVTIVDDCTRSKFAPRARKCIFLGYPFGVKGYNVLDLNSNTVFTSKDVTFHDFFFPFSAQATDFIDAFILWVDTTIESDLGTFVTPVSILDVTLDSSKSFPISDHPYLPEPISEPFAHDVSSNDSISLSKSVPNPLANPPPIRKSTRVHKTLVYLQDYACTAALASPSTTATSHPSGSPYDISACLTYSHLDPAYKSYLMTVSGGPSTQYFSQAVLDPLWGEAMDKEIQALEATKT
ncbi:uncharacterized protein LOC142632879 [Castanea sativa]|uniref:uncharacterized protein LOC142632879 n=1 Tax=Castanea sativa TaxID=21020 RepID=UPI003F64DFF5